MFKKLLPIVMMACMTGCALTGTNFQKAPPPTGNDALIYIYRVDSYAFGGRDAYFYVNDVNIADLTRNGYTRFYAPAGSYVLKQKWPLDISLGLSVLKKPVKWEKGATYYYRFIAGGDFISVPGAIEIKSTLSSPTAEEAIKEISDTKYQEPLGATKLHDLLSK